jgi:hypothetical protein
MGAQQTAKTTMMTRTSLEKIGTGFWTTYLPNRHGSKSWIFHLG